MLWLSCLVMISVLFLFIESLGGLVVSMILTKSFQLCYAHIKLSNFSKGIRSGQVR